MNDGMKGKLPMLRFEEQLAYLQADLKLCQKHPMSNPSHPDFGTLQIKIRMILSLAESVKIAQDHQMNCVVPRRLEREP